MYGSETAVRVRIQNDLRCDNACTQPLFFPDFFEPFFSFNYMDLKNYTNIELLIFCFLTTISYQPIYWSQKTLSLIPFDRKLKTSSDVVSFRSKGVREIFFCDQHMG